MPVMTDGLIADDLWLTAHDTVAFKPRLAPQPLSLALAGGLLAELQQAGMLRLAGDRLYRVLTNERGRRLPSELDDPALDWVLWALDTMERDRQDQPVRHRQPPGFKARDLLAYLAVDNRAEDLVTKRLMNRGMARVEIRKRIFRRAVERRVPRDANVANTPANSIVRALTRHEALSAGALTVASLYCSSGLAGWAFAPMEPDGWAELQRQLIETLSRDWRALLKVAEEAFGDATLTGRR